MTLQLQSFQTDTLFDRFTTFVPHSLRHVASQVGGLFMATLQPSIILFCNAEA